MEGRRQYTIRIGQIGPDGIDAVFPLFLAYLRFYEQEHDEAAARTFLAARMDAGDCVVFLAELDDRPVGFTLLYPGYDSVSLYPAWTLHDLFVAPDVRRSGLARMLMEEAHEFCRRQGAGRVDLATAVTNTVAQPLYESLGYERDEEFFYYSLELRD